MFFIVEFVQSGWENFFLTHLLILTVVIEVNVGRWTLYGRRLMFCLRTDLRSRFYIISSSEIRCGIQNRYNPSARQEIIIFRTNLRVIFLFTTASHLSLPRARSIQSTLPCPPSFLLLFLALQPYMGFGILHQIISGFSIFEEVAPISHFFPISQEIFCHPIYA